MKFSTCLIKSFGICSVLYTGVFAKPDFIRDVKPILEHNCVSCHRADNAKGKIRLDTKEAAFSGDGVIVPGKPDDSSI